ncbi:hypothetical protein D3C80_1313850 [compost metagenome]
MGLDLQLQMLELCLLLVQLLFVDVNAQVLDLLHHIVERIVNRPELNGSRKLLNLGIQVALLNPVHCF